MLLMEPTIVYTDGAASPNPGFGGWATLIHDELHSGGMPYTTNNEMEAYAILSAVGLADPDEHLLIITDSKLCIGWFERGWRCRNPITAGYIDRYREIVAEDNLTVTFRWVKGHSLSAGNDIVDQAAVRASGWIANFNSIKARREFYADGVFGTAI